MTTDKIERMRAIGEVARIPSLKVSFSFRPECASCPPYVDKVAIWDSNRKIRG